MSNEEKPKRPNPIAWRPPSGQEAEVHAMAERHKLSINALITLKVFGGTPSRQSRRSTMSERYSAKTLGIMGHIYDELRALKDALPADQLDASLLQNILDILERIERHLIENRTVIFKSLGRKP